MAMAWTKTGVGHATKDVIVRDPVVVTASLPQFLTPGRQVASPRRDQQRRRRRRRLSPHDRGRRAASASPDADKERTVTLAEKQRLAFNVPITGASSRRLFGQGQPDAARTARVCPKTLALGIRPPGEPVTRRNLVAVNAGGKLTVDDGPLAEFVPGTASVDDLARRREHARRRRHPRRARPLPLWLRRAAHQPRAAAGLSRRRRGDGRARRRQGGARAGPEGDREACSPTRTPRAASASGVPTTTGDLWLDAYVTDFLTRAAEKGYDVPKLARDLALDNLAEPHLLRRRTSVMAARTSPMRLYVLARAGRASIGDLRYYVETKLGNFATALAKAQLGAALALYGDRPRAATRLRGGARRAQRQRQHAAGDRDYGSRSATRPRC